MLEAWRLIGRGQSATLIEISARSRWILPFLFDPVTLLRVSFFLRTIMHPSILNHSSITISPRWYSLLMKTIDDSLFLIPIIFSPLLFSLSSFMNFFLDQIIDYWLFLVSFCLNNTNIVRVSMRLFTKYFQIYSNILSRNTFANKNCS